MSVDEAIKTTLNRSTYYRDAYRLLLRISLLQGITIIILTLLLVALLILVPAEFKYFVTTTDGRILPFTPQLIEMK